MDNNQFNSNNNSNGSYNASQAGSYNANSQQNNAYQYDQQNNAYQYDNRMPIAIMGEIFHHKAICHFIRLPKALLRLLFH